VRRVFQADVQTTTASFVGLAGSIKPAFFLEALPFFVPTFGWLNNLLSSRFRQASAGYFTSALNALLTWPEALSDDIFSKSSAPGPPSAFFAGCPVYIARYSYQAPFRFFAVPFLLMRFPPDLVEPTFYTRYLPPRRFSTLFEGMWRFFSFSFPLLCGAWH